MAGVDKTCPHEDLAYLHALDLLTGADLSYFLAHRQECSACRLRSEELASLTDLLPYASPQVAPSPGLAARLARAISAESPAEGTAQSGDQGGVPATGVPHVPNPGEGSGRGLPWRQGLLWPAAAALFLALSFGSLLVQLGNLQRQVAYLDRLQRQTSSRLDVAESLAAGSLASGAQVILLRPTPEAAGATGEAILVRQQGGVRFLLQAGGLPRLQGGQAYQLWLIDGSTRVSAGTFVVDRDGMGGLAGWIPDGQPFQGLGITLEPDAQGVQPRGRRVLGGALASS